MLQTLVNTAGRLLSDLQRVWRRERLLISDPEVSSWIAPGFYRPLRRVTLADEVGRTLFEEFAAHRQGERGDEETGWLLLGLRQESEAVVLATLPAGANRDAGVAHVQFSSGAQVLGSRIVRQRDKRLVPVGVVH